MPARRRIRLLSQLLAASPELDTKTLCQVGAQVTGTSGAGIMLMSGAVAHGGVAYSDEVSALVESLQFALGEGPCVDAYHTNQAVLEPDLAHPASSRWPAFTGPVLDAGVRAIFGFPLRVGAVPLGAIDLYRDQPGPLSAEEHADALAMADVVATVVLAVQAQAPPGQVAPQLDDGSGLQYVVHQASGMVAAQLEVSVGQALSRLRAYAFGNERSLREVAQDVVERRLRFDQTDRDDPAQ